MDLLSSLNEKQREAAAHDVGPILVIAGAGTGKTRVLTHRIANLIQTGKARPWEILSITFTNKAANEMKERIGQLIDYSIDRMWIGTFHSICVRILRSHIDRIGYDRNFVIYDTDDQKTLIKDCIKERNLDSKSYNANVIRSIISTQKNDRVSPDKFISENYGNFNLRNIGEVYALYENKLKKSNALDFDDLIVKALKLLETNEDILESYRERFKYILVDEYQDTNKVQYNLVKILGQKSTGESNVFVVGDEDQSIYGWRGADINNILDFEKDFKGAKVVKLEKNYRSTNVILDAANGVIKNNNQRKGKNLYTDCCEGNLIKLVETDNEKEEAFMVSALMRKEHKQNNISFSDMAVLYRTNAQSRALEEGLIREGIPYKIVGGLKFYGRREIKDIMSYLMLIQNQKDDISLLRIINVPKRKIGQKTIDTLSDYANSQNISLFEAAYDAENLDLTKAAAKSIQDFVAMIEMLMIKKDVMSLSEFMEAVYEETGYKKMLLEDVTVEGRSRIENINEFLSAAKDFEERYEENSLEDFLSHTSLLADVDKTDENSTDCVTLLTVHSAKGLEYDTVFITGMEERMFPMIRNDDEEDDMEEERRLFYVAVTRAKRMLYISYTNERIVFGHHEMRTRSRFIKEIPDCCFDSATAQSIADKKIKSFTEQSESSFGSSGGRSFSFEEARNKKLFKGTTSFGSNSISNNDTKDIDEDVLTNKEEKQSKLKSDKLTPGDKIMHKAWGMGTIVQISGAGDSQKAVIAFDNKGIKTVMLSYAPIEKI